jgi:tetratricopeptide (TPR) repeat protein
MKKNKIIEATKELQAEEKKSNRFIYLIIGFLTFFVFANTIGNDYNMDDELVTRNHPLTSQGMRAIGEIFTSPYYQDDMGYVYGYRPIVHVSFAIEHELFGEKASVSHFVNVILYVACVLLFLSLLLKWVGEQNKWIAIIAVLFFALHPIHTEVVASIKNRDELLAFFFALLSALAMIKFVEKGKWWSLFWIAFYFALGMLSKKSIFSLTIILPISAVLLHSISWKKLFYIVFAFSVPSAIISPELSFSRFTLFLIIPWILVVVFYYLKVKIFSNDPFLNSVLYDFNFWAGITIFTASYALFSLNYYLIPFIIILSIFCYYKKTEYGIILLSLVISAIGLRFNHIEFSYFGFIIIANYTYGFYIKKEKISIIILGTLVFALLILFILNPVINQAISVFTILFFLWLLNKKVLFGLFFSISILIISYLIDNTINNFGIIMFPFSMLLFLIEFLKPSNFYKFIPLISIVVIFFLPSVRSHYYYSEPSNSASNYLTKKVESKNSSSQSLLLEGRHLEYVENTLVAKHSFQETLGTGFSTIGEYAKLIVFPYELSFYYGFSRTKTVSLNNAWISLIFHFGLISLAIWQLKKRPILSIGIGWYLLSILLFSNWFELVAGMVGERLAFTASAGFSIFIGVFLFSIKPNFNLLKPKGLELVFLVLIIFFSIKSFVRNNQWKDSLFLMKNDIKHLKYSAQANNLYALNLMNKSNELTNGFEKNQMQKQAQKHFLIATKIHSDFFNAQFDLGKTSLIVKDTNMAIQSFKKVIKLDSKFPDSYLSLVSIYESKEDWQDYFKNANQLFSVYDSWESYIILGRAYLELNNLEKSKNIIISGLKKYPNNNNLLNCLKDLDVRISNR